MMLKLLKVATPFTAFTVVVPKSTAPLVPVPGVMAKVTGRVYVVNVLPCASCSVTAGWVPKAVPTVLLLLGWVVKTNFAGATLKVLLVARVRPVLLAVRV